MTRVQRVNELAPNVWAIAFESSQLGLSSEKTDLDKVLPGFDINVIEFPKASSLLLGSYVGCWLESRRKV